jgi:hypothetical protein
MIETLIAAPIVVVVVVVGSALLYRWFAEAWMTRASREAAVCLVGPRTTTACRQKLEASLRRGLIFNRAMIAEFRRTATASRVRVTLELIPVGDLPRRIETFVSHPKFD